MPTAKELIESVISEAVDYSTIEYTLDKLAARYGGYFVDEAYGSKTHLCIYDLIDGSTASKVATAIKQATGLRGTPKVRKQADSWVAIYIVNSSDIIDDED